MADKDMTETEEIKESEEVQDLTTSPEAQDAATDTESVLEPDVVEDEPSQELSDEVEEEESNDSLTFSNGVIEKIVAIAVRDVPGVLGMKGGFVNRIQETFGQSVATKGVTVEITPDNSMSVNIAVVMEYGAYAPQVFEDVKKVVVDQVTGMTGLEVGSVNLRIEDVLTAEEYSHLKSDDETEAE